MRGGAPSTVHSRTVCPAISRRGAFPSPLDRGRPTSTACSGRLFVQNADVGRSGCSRQHRRPLRARRSLRAGPNLCRGTSVAHGGLAVITPTGKTPENRGSILAPVRRRSGVAALELRIQSARRRAIAPTARQTRSLRASTGEFGAAGCPLSTLAAG